MGAIEKDRHRPWLAYALEESLERSLLAPRDVIDYANPEVLVRQLPPAVISELLSRALMTGTFSPAQVLESAPPALLAEHLNPDVMWRCLKEAADRGGLSRKGVVRSAPARQWFASVVAQALSSELITPSDVVRFLSPAEFVGDAPRPVLAELIKSALGRGTFDAALVLEHITPTVIAEHLETSLVWACIAEAAARHFELGPATARADESTLVRPPMAAAPVTAAPATTSAATSTSTSTPAAIAKSVAKTIDRDKAAVERRASLSSDKSSGSAAPTATLLGAVAAKPLPSAARTTAPVAAAVAAVAAGTPGAPGAAGAPSAPPTPSDVSEWSVADDLDVLEDQPLPLPR